MRRSESSKIFSTESDFARLCSKTASMAIIVAIRLYQLAISPMLGANCRFYPSCSAYARKAVEIHGPAYGSLLALKRLSKCHPFHPGGYDPVPEKANW